MAPLSVIGGLLLILLSHLRKTASAQSCGPKVRPRFLSGIPCDMARNSFCAAAGSAYPWNSLRRYIYENQGLMRRMYGDERHSMILHSELQHRSYASWNKNTIRSGRVSLESNDFITIPDDILPERYRRGNASIRSTTSKLKTSSTTPNSTEIRLSSTASASSTTAQPLAETTETQNPSTETTVTEQLGEDDQYQYQGTTSLLESEYEEDYDVVSTVYHPTSTTPAPTINPQVPNEQLPTTQSLIADEKMYYNTQNVEESQVISTNSVEEKETAPTTTTETKKEPTAPEPPKGFNACPIKEEVIAPYWANNTRGETLALLNVYPFEQYVHWEKCAYENHQMFCRDGCRCEQQFRLHRLLAFDPSNSCRGVFADWFRFPSCCVCVCYNLTDTVPKL